MEVTLVCFVYHVLGAISARCVCCPTALCGINYGVYTKSICFGYCLDSFLYNYLEYFALMFQNVCGCHCLYNQCIDADFIVKI